MKSFKIVAMIRAFQGVEPALAQGSEIFGTSNSISSIRHFPTAPDFRRIAIAACLRAEAKKTNRSDDVNALKQKFGSKNFLCSFVVKPDGTINSLQIVRSSGSLEIDERALSLVRSCAPFKKNESSTENMTCLIQFPRMTPRLSYE